ncbi:MAG TPA: SURF1 family protein [Mycobacteriales bacterium]|nr:SURF1 family protein [Mycobacteriales bacterium]
MLSFLRRPKWVIFGIVCVVFAVSFVSLGFWQLRRLESVRTENVRILDNRDKTVSAAADVLSTERPPAADVEYQRVTATGRFDTDHEIVVRGRQVGADNGAFVITPLVTDAGPVLLVVRGWVPAAPRADQAPAVPAATRGEVTVVGRVRMPETGTGPSRPADVGRFLSVTRILPEQLAERVGRPTYDAYVEQLEQTPAAAQPAPVAIPQGALEEGNHESYAYQWFTFAVMAVGGYVLLIVLETRKRKKEAGDAGGEPAREPTLSR